MEEAIKSSPYMHMQQIFHKKFTIDRPDNCYNVNMGHTGVKKDWSLWCEENCIGYWYYIFLIEDGKSGLSFDNLTLMMKFTNETDAILFKLTFR